MHSGFERLQLKMPVKPLDLKCISSLLRNMSNQPMASLRHEHFNTLESSRYIFVNLIFMGYYLTQHLHNLLSNLVAAKLKTEKELN